MAIQRSGPTPNYYEYICNYLLIPYSGAPSPHVQALTAPGQQLNWIDIPRFQRGISWNIDNVKELLQSTSILLGNAILSQFNRNQLQFPNLPQNQPNYLVLVDGLQRLAVGTALLAVLHDQVLSPAPNRPGDAHYFVALAARVVPFSAIYQHNDKEFLAHPRQAIRDQYAILRNEIDEYIQEELIAGRGKILADVIVPTFVARQLALDIYFNFQRTELLNTFIGINTVRVDLGPVDLLRAHILEKATSAGWSEADIESIENDFTETLTVDQKPKQHFLPFVNAAIKAIEKNAGNRLFASWGTALSKADVDQFLDFVDKFEGSLGNEYLREIFECGKLPVSTVFAYYYTDFLHGSKTSPSFFTGGRGCDQELHSYLILCYRLILDGSVGRTTEYLENIISGGFGGSLASLADAISVAYLGLGISNPLDVQWLDTHLNKIDKKKAARIFNAMLLPQKQNMGYAYNPLKFGRLSTEFHVDHLIPASLLDLQAPGGLDGETLRNFSPLPTNQNRVAKATSCSTKLSPGGIYANYIGGNTHLKHPYCYWLMSVQATNYQNKNMDDQSLLEKNSSPDIGSERIAKIRDELLSRI